MVGSSVPHSDPQQARWHDLAWIGGVVALAMLASGYLFLSFYRVMDGGLRETRRHLRAMSEGDLTTSPRAWGKDESAQLMQELSRMQASLRGMVHSVRRSSDGIVQASDEVAGGADDLSARTEHAAAALEQSATGDGADCRQGEQRRQRTPRRPRAWPGTTPGSPKTAAA